jgi:hypothetical protein
MIAGASRHGQPLSLPRGALQQTQHVALPCACLALLLAGNEHWVDKLLHE